MTATLLDQIAEGAPGVMLVVSAADLKNVVGEMCRAHYRQTEDAILKHREHPTMTRREVARALNITLSTLWRWAKDGYLVPVKIGTKVLYRASDIDRMLERKGGAQ